MVLNNKKAYPEVCFTILKELQDQLPGHLSYHSINHIIDVANVSNEYIKHYEIEESIARLIRIAAIGHDYGYIVSPLDHEERSIKDLMPYLKPVLSKEEIAIVGGLIRATKVPQDPKNFYEEILADADLDYLGRNDYERLSQKLYEEFLHYGVVQNDQEWLDTQIMFLERHVYHTLYAKEHRAKTKAKKLKELKTSRHGSNV